MEKLLEKEPELKKIVFNDASPEISDVAFLALCRAVNKRRPFCSKDSVDMYFIAEECHRGER